MAIKSFSEFEIKFEGKDSKNLRHSVTMLVCSSTARRLVEIRWRSTAAYLRRGDSRWRNKTFLNSTPTLQAAKTNGCAGFDWRNGYEYRFTMQTVSKCAIEECLVNLLRGNRSLCK